MDWNTQKVTAPTILKVMMKSKATKMVRVGIKLTVKDNENKNVVFPVSEIKENLFSNDSKQAFVFLKIDPSKTTWGDIDCQVTVKLGKTTQMSAGNYSTYNGGYSTGTYYGGVGYGNTTGTTTTTTSTSYTPISYDNDGESKVSCVHCKAQCYVGEDFCSKCGQCPTDDADGV